MREELNYFTNFTNHQPTKHQPTIDHLPNNLKTHNLIHQPANPIINDPLIRFYLKNKRKILILKNTNTAGEMQNILPSIIE